MRAGRAGWARPGRQVETELRPAAPLAAGLDLLGQHTLTACSQHTRLGAGGTVSRFRILIAIGFDIACYCRFIILSLVATCNVRRPFGEQASHAEGFM